MVSRVAGGLAIRLPFSILFNMTLCSCRFRFPVKTRHRVFSRTVKECPAHWTNSQRLNLPAKLALMDKRFLGWVGRIKSCSCWYTEKGSVVPCIRHKCTCVRHNSPRWHNGADDACVWVSMRILRRRALEVACQLSFPCLWWDYAHPMTTPSHNIFIIWKTEIIFAISIFWNWKNKKKNSQVKSLKTPSALSLSCLEVIVYPRNHHRLPQKRLP